MDFVNHPENKRFNLVKFTLPAPPEIFFSQHLLLLRHSERADCI